MTKPTTSRATLRGMICLENQMAFHRTYGSYLSPDSASDSTSLVDASLAESDDKWNNSWLYVRTTDETTKISDWTSSSYTGTLSPYLVSGLADSDEYEILTHFNPREIHQAIDRSIRDGFPAFFEDVTDETLVLQEDKLTYDLTSLTYRPWTMVDVCLERPSVLYTSQATAAGDSTVTCSDATFDTDADSDWYASIYDGTGKGQLREVSSVDSDGVITIGTNWTTNPDTTSKIALWDASEEENVWYPLVRLRFDQMEYPTKMYMSNTPPSYLGARLRLRYTAVPGTLSADTDETQVPAEFVVAKAMSILCKSRANDNRADRRKYSDLHTLYTQEAEMIRRTRAFQQPSITMWHEPSWSPVEKPDDPLGWYGR